MTKLRVLLASLVVLLVFSMSVSESRANDVWTQANWNVPGFGVSGNLYGLGIIPAPPYFAIHPPVYYGHRYYRSYGESPFARPARTSRPLIVSVEVIKNPFVTDMMPIELPAAPAQGAAPQEAQVAPAEMKTASQPKMIINPFYRAEDEVVQK